MSKRIQSVLCLSLCLLLALLTPRPAAAESAKPIKMSEVSSLIKAGVSPEAVLEVMVKRGVSFRVTSTAERRLGKWGFSEAQIGLIRRLAKGERVDLDEVSGPAEDEPPGEGGDDAGPGEPGAFPVGYPNPAGWHAAEQQRIERAVDSAGLGYKRIEFKRFTLYCNERRARALAPMLKKLEHQLIAKFPASIRNASSPKSAHLVIVDGQTQWSNWVDSVFASYKQDGINFSFGPGGDGMLDEVKKGPGFILPDCSVCNANTRSDDESVARYAAYSVGYLMMGEAGGKEQPKGLRTGFGNYAEALAMGSPSVMIYSYEKRDLGKADAWRDLVIQRFENKDIDGVSKPWNYDTADMKIEHYAECWSYVSTLAEAPDQFAAAVGMLRDGEAKMFDAVLKAYEVGDRDLLKAWYRYVKR